ncbi:hypothetical protein PCS_00672 [Desulfocurvibacter africanus PCS]|uniref:Bacterial nucleoid DNA-binding protein n=2 Tax=Desulfocurvibacter africanus TaxID=873 RepID=M5PYF8_DESAF|nr:hypothetical protein PCS_00672 [Desulfocurvibacter africanus PCS]
MVNMDYPGVCLACTDENCNVEYADVDAARARVHETPLTGYTKTIVKNLQSTFPEKFPTEEDAYLTLDVMKAIIAMGLNNDDSVDIQGLGTFKTKQEGGHKVVTFSPETALVEAISK